MRSCLASENAATASVGEVDDLVVLASRPNRVAVLAERHDKVWVVRVAGDMIPIDQATRD